MSENISNEERIMLTKALLKATAIMGINLSDLAATLSIGVSKIVEIENEGCLLDPGKSEWRQALLLIQVYVHLSALVGNDEINIRHWLHTDNRHLGGMPVKLLQSPDNLVDLVNYLGRMSA